MIKTKEELLESIRSKIGEDSSDETIALLEDVTDTFDDLETKALQFVLTKVSRTHYDVGLQLVCNVFYVVNTDEIWCCHNLCLFFVLILKCYL